MTISLTNLSKRYRYEWIFKNISTQFQTGNAYAILGPNGSGKSTLLKILSGHLSPSQGKIEFTTNNQSIDKDDVYRSIAYAAPYMDLIEEFTLTEAIDFHRKFKPFKDNPSTQSLINLLGLQSSAQKSIKFFSSGMKQRLKLLLAISSDTPILLLDEPTSNLDAQGVEWYKTLIQNNLRNRLIIIASNTPHEYDCCNETIEIKNYK